MEHASLKIKCFPKTIYVWQHLNQNNMVKITSHTILALGQFQYYGLQFQRLPIHMTNNPLRCFNQSQPSMYSTLMLNAIIPKEVGFFNGSMFHPNVFPFQLETWLDILFPQLHHIHSQQLFIKFEHFPPLFRIILVNSSSPFHFHIHRSNFKSFKVP